MVDIYWHMHIIIHMKPVTDKERQVIEALRHSGIARASDFRAAGIHSEYLRRLCATGRIERASRGLYTLPDAEVTMHHGLALTAKAVPKSVVCLLSALRFHEIGTESPYEVWIAVNRRAARPRMKYPRLRVMRFSGDAFTEGIDVHTVEGVRVSIYNPAKTVADCFKYRNKIGLDVALEALRHVMRRRTCTVDDLWRYAKVCRVTGIIRPYMEALL
ncbi:type IV toxin-antitoxin system AbiEi family antitoxin domain-containing protein [Candidatus Hydrogenedentota bacterium]